ncbi:hypothetical protein Pan110_03900 [Gimesia panareensis]|nr:hypothetical protein Pan110_03900 [Gimesia panareensis]
MCPPAWQHANHSHFRRHQDKPSKGNPECNSGRAQRAGGLSEIGQFRAKIRQEHSSSPSDVIQYSSTQYNA